MNERCKQQVDVLAEIIGEYGPEVELSEADEFDLEDVEGTFGREVPGFLYAWLMRVGGAAETIAPFGMSFGTMRLRDAHDLWAKDKRGFMIVALGEGVENHDYYYDLSRPSSPEGDDFEVVSMSREASHPPRQGERDRAHGYYRLSPSLREFMSFRAFQRLRLEPRGNERDVIASPLRPEEVVGWMARFEEVADKSGFRPVGGLEGQWRLHDRGDASVTLTIDMERGFRIVGIGADDEHEADLLAQRFIDRMKMRLVPTPRTPMF